MPFSHRAFCRVPESPSLSEVLVRLRQNGHAAKFWGGQSVGEPQADLLSCYWDEAHLVTGDNQAPLRLTCLRSGAESGGGPMQDSVADFMADVAELPPSGERERVLKHLAGTRVVLVVEFPASEADAAAEEAGECVTMLFAERADGLTQRDGVGFLDEDDDLVLALG